MSDQKTVAVLMTNYFEQAEFTGPKQALEEAGYAVKVISSNDGKMQGMNGDVNMADTFGRDTALEDANPADYAAVVVPGGTVNADTLRQESAAIDFVSSMLEAGKPTAVICHGPWLLVSGDLVRGRTLTSFPSLAPDIRNAGGNWVDQTVAVDDNLITSRNPNDIPAFNEAILAALQRQPAGASV